MTVVNPGDSGAVAIPEEFNNIGLEDISATDVVIPRISINHREATFKNNLTGEVFPELKAIVLGLVKQRIMWPEKQDEGDKPLCKSPDFDHGFPNLNMELKADKRFPEGKSNFNLADYPPERGLNGLTTLPCNSCIFSQWDKEDWKAPPCSEQHTYPLLYTLASDEQIEAGEADWIPALFTVQRTAIKNSRAFISSFAQSKTPMFTVVSKITLDLNKRGTVEYSVPKFVRGAQTDRNYWAEYGQQARSIREFVRTPPRNYDEDEEAAVTVPSSNENTAPPEAAAPVATPTPTAATAPVAASEPVDAEVVETPAAPAPAAAAEPAPAAPAAAPAADDDLPF